MQKLREDSSYGYGKKKTPIGHFANSGEGFEQVGGSNGKMDRKLRALNTKVLTNRKCAAAVSALNLPMREPASNEICLKVSAKKNLWRVIAAVQPSLKASWSELLAA